MSIYNRLAVSLSLALAVVLCLCLPPAPLATAQSGGPLLGATPEALEATVPLGATAELTFALRNNSGAAVSPRLYEAVLPGDLPAQLAGQRVASAALPAGTPRLDPQLARAAAQDREVEAIVVLDEQADLSAAYAIDSWVERGRYVYTTLRAHAEARQGELLAALEVRGLAATPLWIVNAIAVRGSAAEVAALAGEPDVAAVWASKVAELDVQPAEGITQIPPALCAAGADNACWNIARIGANRVWSDFGVRGEGITVATIDSGVRYDHPALIGSYRGSGPGGVRHDYQWFDAYEGQPTPRDSGNHGTHTMGTLVAQGGTAAEPAVGVAPGARWIAVRACSARDCSEVDLIRAAQWLLAPTDLAGENPRPDLRPHVVSNSWTGGQNAGWYMGYVAAWRAAGIYPVFAAGNAGNLAGCSTMQSPGDYAQVTAVGATDDADRLTSFSSVGPTLGGRLKPDLTAPGQAIYSTLADQRAYGANSGTSMAAPHVAGAVALLWAANPTLIGDYEATYAILTGAATPQIGDSRYLGAAHEDCRPESSPNNIYGHGRLDTYAAVARASVDVPWLLLGDATPGVIAPAASADTSLTLDARMVPGPGVYQARVLVHGDDLGLPPAAVTVTLRVPADPAHAIVSGQVTRAADGAPLRAAVEVAGGARVLADAAGRYSLTLPPTDEPYRLVATARDYLPANEQILLAAGARATIDFALDADQPRLAADTAPRRVELSLGERTTLLLPVANLGTRPLSYTLSIPAERFGVWRSDEPDGPPAAWIDPPAEAVTVSLADDGVTEQLPISFGFPYYSTSHRQFAIFANGVISLGPLPARVPGYVNSCLPLAETPGPAIAPLRADLDPDAAGARVSYTHLPEGLLVSWENVPLYDQPDNRLSFQALLMPDGRISLRYKDVGAIVGATSPSAGLQRSLAEVQSLGCKEDLPIGDGLTIELRPQPPATLWLELEQPAGSVEPGAQAGIPVAARWASARPFQRAFSGAVVLRSNDPAAPVTRFTVRMDSVAAPYELRLLQIFAR